MPFTIVVNIDGLTRKFDTLAESARDLDKPLKKFGGYLRKRAIERYKAQDFAPLAESTIAHRTEKGKRSLEKKLHKDIRKALAKEAPPKVKQSFVERLMGAAPVGLVTAPGRAARARMSVLAEFQRTHRRGVGGLAAGAGGKELSIKQLASLGKREDRAVAKAVGKPILGSLPGTLEVIVGRGSVTLISKTSEGWTDVHNQGGSAGHGAKIPKRETVKVEDRDLDVLGEILKEHMLLAFKNVGG